MWWVLIAALAVVLVFYWIRSERDIGGDDGNSRD
jgi:hypothetical protein